ncbi:MAG: FAD-dependent oxidoreductase [Polyangiaceae bacterium]|nr:FAD-dependent oxidoreductase [Polyangiaceae bacterium]
MSDAQRPAAPAQLLRQRAPEGWRGKTRIVVLGGGFAGAYAAKGLEKRLRGRSDVEVILISNENYLVFQPMLPEVISGTIGLLDVVTPLRDIIGNVEMHVRDVERVDTEQRFVQTSLGFENNPHVIEYDHLVVALGNVTDFRGMRGLPEHAFPFKNLADALQLRNHVIKALDEAALCKLGTEQRSRLLTFVVSGGGFSGVEVAAELNDFVRRVARQHYPGIDPKEPRVILLHGMERILPEMPPSLADYAHRLLSGRGVEIKLQAWLSAATGDSAILKSGEVIATKTLVSTVPASPNPVVDAMTLEKTRGRIVVDEYLRSKSHPNIWAIGDCATVPVLGGGFAPPTAQHAIREAALVAENIASVLTGGKPRPFQFKGLGKLGSLGRHSAVAEVFGMKFSGFIAWWLWRTIYLMKMPSFRRRLKVAISWTLDLFLPPELVQLRLEGSSGIDRQHFEPGELVFCEGDAADCLYILLEGKAEVVRGDKVVAELAPGEYFGEMALLGQGRTQRNATVRCLEPMNVLCLPKKEFGLLAAHMPGVRQSFESVAQRRATLFGLKRGGPGEASPALDAMAALRAQQRAAQPAGALPAGPPQNQLPQLNPLGSPPAQQPQPHGGQPMQPHMLGGQPMQPQMLGGQPMQHPGLAGLPVQQPQAYANQPPQAYAGQPAQPQAYAGQPAQPQAYAGQPAQPQAYAGQPAQQAYAGQPAQPQAYAGQPAPAPQAAYANVPAQAALAHDAHEPMHGAPNQVHGAPNQVHSAPNAVQTAKRQRSGAPPPLPGVGSDLAGTMPMAPKRSGQDDLPTEASARDAAEHAPPPLPPGGDGARARRVRA